ncbi:cell division protein FtsQ/DivIB [Bartonella sp. DGB1]|uniref:cell division protein FtsQ/DivIB n=1 Tax=Bartonella sp. DGB1 TaxID=3239807 RepID=UPI003523A7A3
MQALITDTKMYKNKISINIIHRWWKSFSFAMVKFCRAFPVLPKRFGIYLSIWLFLLTFVYGAIIGGHLTMIVNNVSKYLGITVTKVNITGLHYLKEKNILEILAYQKDQSILDFDIWEAKKRIEQLPWVEKVSLTKYYPNNINIDVVERKPFAILQIEDNFKLVDKFGTILTNLERDQLPALPLIAGKADVTKFVELWNSLKKYPVLLNRISGFIWVSGRRWDILLRDNVQVKLPEFNWKDKIKQLVFLQEKYSSFLKDINVIDLRLEDRITLQVTNKIKSLNDARIRSALKNAPNMSSLLVR